MILLGALSTSSFASFKPKPVSSLTNLTTANFEPPAALSTTVNSDFSSAASSPVAPDDGPETTAAAAAGSIPYSSFRISASSFTSFTVKFTNFSAKSFKSAIFYNLSYFNYFHFFQKVFLKHH